MLKKATKKAKIYKAVTLHCFSHSYARHLHEAESNVRFNQELLRHKNSKNNEIYTQMSQKSL